jgi:uncharacterized protein (UPF0335 family)
MDIVGRSMVTITRERYDFYVAEIERLRKDKAELLKALTDLYEACRWEKVAPEIDAAKTAINKATGKPAAEGE